MSLNLKSTELKYFHGLVLGYRKDFQLKKNKNTLVKDLSTYLTDAMRREKEKEFYEDFLKLEAFYSASAYS